MNWKQQAKTELILQQYNSLNGFFLHSEPIDE